MAFRRRSCLARSHSRRRYSQGRTTYSHRFFWNCKRACRCYHGHHPSWLYSAGCHIFPSCYCHRSRRFRFSSALTASIFADRPGKLTFSGLKSSRQNHHDRSGRDYNDFYKKSPSPTCRTTILIYPYGR